MLRKLPAIQYSETRVGIGNGTDQAGKEGKDQDLNGFIGHAKS